MPYIKGINFRDKEYGWKKYSFSLHLAKSLDEGEKNTVFRSPKDDNLYMRFFLSDTISRPSCHTCQAKYGKSGADITVGDYWWIDEIHPEFDDDKGCSVVYVFSDKGKQSIGLVKYNCKILKTDTLSDIKKAYLLEGAFATPSKPNKTRTKFFSEYDHKSLEELTSLSIRVKSCSDKAFIVTKKIIKRIGIFNVAKQIYKSLR